MPCTHHRRIMLLAASISSTMVPTTAWGQSVVGDAPATVAAETGSVEDPVQDGDGDIVVTARRRDENAQDVPIALSVVGADTLAATGNFTLGQVQQLVPSLQVFSFNPRNTNVNIRGLGSNVAFSNDGLENGVGIYIDNVYYGRLGQSQFDLVDLQQIEVLRGPQGTLFGKNTTSGAINITSRLPSFDFEVSGEATVGDFGYHQVRVSASGPITEGVAARLSIADTHRDGFIRNVVTGQDVQDYDNFTARGQLLIEPTESLSIRLIGDYSRQTAQCCINLLVGTYDRYENGAPIDNDYLERVARAGYTPLPFDPFARRTDFDSRIQANMEGYGVSGQLDWDVAGHRLTAITAYRWWDWNPANDNDYTGQDILRIGQTANRQRQFSQEIRLASQDTGAIDYVVGAFYFWQVVRGYNRIAYGSEAASFNLPTVPAVLGVAALDGFGSSAYSDPTTKSYAVFGQGTWTITDAVKLTGGLRYTHEDKEGRFNQVQTGGADLSLLPAPLAAAAAGIRTLFSPAVSYSTGFSDDSVSGLVSLSYVPARDVLLYASYARGSKSGGLNLSVLPPGVSPEVAPETVDNVEIGIKSQFFDRSVTFNLAAFNTDVSDYQTAIIELRGVTALTYIDNIPKVRSRGLEGDLVWSPSRLIQLSASGAYTDATYRSYANAIQAPERLNLGPSQDLSGERLAGVSEFSYTLGADLAQPVGNLVDREVELYGHADFAHRSSYYTIASNSRYALVPGYGILNARLGLRADDGLWDLSVWARNLTDTDYFQTLSVTNYGLVTAIVGEPRTFGVTLRTRL